MRLALLKYHRASGCFAFLALLFFFQHFMVAQSGQAGQFGCPGRTEFFDKPAIPFGQMKDASAIAKWKTRPSVTFDGFDEKRYGFSKITFYRWRISLQPGSQDADPADQAENGDATNRLALAVQVVSTNGERWFELGQVPVGQNYPSDDLVIQPAQQDDPMQQDQPDVETGKQKPTQDEMEKWISITPATPDHALPLFTFNFEYHNTGANAAGTIGNELLLDVRGKAPQIVKAAQCIEWDGGGACTAPDTANAVYDNLNCRWEQPASDFHCTMAGAFGGDYAARVAEKDFYLISNEPARPSWQKDDTPADLAGLALRLSKDPKATARAVMVPKLGPVNLLARYHDLLPGSEVLLFASPDAGPALSTHFFEAIVPAHGQPTVQDISKWVISGEETDEDTPRDGFTPSSGPTPLGAQFGVGAARQDEYRVSSLEAGPRFHALQVILNSSPLIPSGIKGALGVHVVYWIGIEALSGKLIANGVRLASEGSTYGHCGQDLHDGTAITVRQKPGIAEATVTVRPQDVSVDMPHDEGNENQCMWNGFLRWKSGSGFRVRKTWQDCKQELPEVSITDDGTITKKRAQAVQETH